MKCYRAKETAVNGLRGSDDDSYSKLPEYLYMLKLANPGSVADLETETDELDLLRFKYVFLSFAASILGFRRLRHIIVLDGTHLTGKFKGVLLTACGQDANFQVYPLAFGIVDSENDDSWKWFLTKLERILADSTNLSIISDRHRSILTAVKHVYPRAHHGACVVHLQRNVTSRFKNKGLSKLVGMAAFAYRVKRFRAIFAQISSTNPACAKYLHDIGIATWAKAHFKGDRYNLMTSNACEQLNKSLREGRSSPILELLQFIQSMMTRWFSARRKKSQRHKGIITPEMDKEITSNLKKAKGSKINTISSWSLEIIGQFGEKNNVLLKDHKCTCMLYERLKIPCGHALMAADCVGLPYGSLVADCFKTKTWCDTYQAIISPEGDPKDVDIPQEISSIVLLPPKTRRPSGRPKQARYTSTGEIRVSISLSFSSF
ncbi:uncharacterized protein LOC112087730 [Eutrema salsugineum]|uniref:uncharacterized protein LOC112087730 n=1 Tax=Eutrema salsugineum TaxID=72664 RepID=UPI000CECFB9E|nr:uncharacterized protein LOC112087730 [Eutrema salsugineum]